MMEYTGQGITFFYATPPCFSDLKHDLDRILITIANTEDLNTMQSMIVEEVLVACRQKFRNKPMKCQKSLQRRQT